MKDALVILLQSKLDVAQSVQDINKQIEHVEKQINKIDIETNLNTDSITKQTDKINKQFEKVAKTASKPIDIKAPNVDKVNNQFKEMNNWLSTISGFDPEKTPLHKGMKIIGYSVKDAKDGMKKFTQTLNDGKDHIITYNGVLNQSTGHYEVLGRTVRQSTRDNQSFTKELDIAIRRSITWAMGMTAVYGSLRKLQEGVGFIQELDKELTQVSIITGITRDEARMLAQEYANLGDELYRTVTDISAVNTELIRQGLSIEEAEHRLRTVMRLNAVSGIGTDVEDTLKIITASVNAMGEEAERAADIILKTSQISASSVEEIGEAFTKVASSAKTSGMDMTQSSAILAGMLEVTQESASSLGNSLKTLIARFNQVNSETGEINDELNDVQEAFESVGVTFTDAYGQIRPVYDLFSDMSAIWDTLDKNTKNYIATTAAGVRQQNRFFAIMDNMERIHEIQEELTHSNGTLQQSYEAYTDSIEASANRMKLAFEQMWINAINSDAIKGFYDFATLLIKITDKIGILNLAIMVLTTRILATNDSLKVASKLMAEIGIRKTISELGLLDFSLKNLGLTLDATKLKTVALQAAMTLGLSIAISMVISGLTKLIFKLANYREEQRKAILETQNHIESLEEQKHGLRELADEYNALSSKESLTTEEKQRLYEIQRQLVEQYGVSATGIDEQGRAYTDNIELINKRVEALDQELEKEKELMFLRLESQEKSNQKHINKELENQEKLLDRIANKEQELARLKSFAEGAPAVMQPHLQVAIKSTQDAILGLNESLAESGVKLQEYTQGQIQAFHMELNTLGVNLSETNRAIAERFITTLSYMEGSIEQKRMTIAALIEDLSDSGLDQLTQKYDEAAELFKFDPTGENAARVDTYANKIRNVTNALLNEYIPANEESNSTLIKSRESIQDLISTMYAHSDAVNTVANDTDILAEKEAILAAEAKRAQEVYDKQLEIFNDVTKSIQDLYVAMHELNSEEGLSAQMKQQLITLYPEIIAYIEDEAALRDFLKVKIHEQEVAQANAYQNMLENSDTYYNEILKANSELWNNLREAYGIDAENFRTFAELKMAINAEAVKKIGLNWQNLYNVLSRGGRKIGALTTQRNVYMKFYEDDPEMRRQVESAYNSQINAMQDAMAEYRSIKNELDSFVSNVSPGTLSSINRAGIKIPKAPKRKSRSTRPQKTKSSKTSKKAADNVDKVTDAIRKFLDSLQNKTAITEFNIEMNSLDQSYYEAIGNMNQVNKLRVNEINLYKKLNNQLNSNIKSIKNKMKSTKKDTENYRALEDALFRYTQQVRQNEIAIKELQNTLKEYDRQLRARVIEGQELVLEAVRNRVKAEYDANKKILQDRIDTLNKERALLREEYNRRQEQKQEEKKREELRKLEERYNKLSRDNSGMYEQEKLQLQQQIADLREEIYDDELLKQIENREKAIDDQIDKYQQEMDLLDAHYAEMEDTYRDYWIEVEKIMKGSQSSIINFLTSNLNEYKRAGELQREAYLDGWGELYKEVKDIQSGKTKTSSQIKREVGSSTGKNYANSATSGSSGSSKSSQSSNYPGILKRGSRGSNVKKIQQKVGVKADGIYGAKTESAVKAYQRKHGLTADGIVGAKTWAKMFGGNKGGSSAPKYPGLLKRGSRGSNVKKVQKELGITADGIYGARTEAAVRAFQKKNKLAADGIVGSKTWAKLFKGYMAGGLVDYTGLAMVHGKPQKPEAFLNAKQTVLVGDLANTLSKLPPNINSAIAGTALGKQIDLSTVINIYPEYIDDRYTPRDLGRDLGKGIEEHFENTARKSGITLTVNGSK